MSYYMCTSCGAVYKTEAKKTCSDILCGGFCFEVDENMIIPITVLTEKGYKTMYCCSGHINRSSCGGYIAFVLGSEPKTVPKGWTMDDGNRCIRYSFPKKHMTNEEEKYKIILQKMQSLNKWCMDLPYREE